MLFLTIKAVNKGIKKRKKILQTTMSIIFSDILLDEQILFLPQVKRSVIISNKLGIYKLPDELTNDLRLSILGNYYISTFHISNGPVY